MVFKRAFFLAASLVALPLAVTPDLGLVPSEAFSQQMGNDAWNYPRASRGFWANYQAVRKTQDGVAGGAGGGGSGAEVIYYHSTSTAIANQNLITQELGDGATGIIGNQVDQISDGNQTAETTTGTNNNPSTFNDLSSNSTTVNTPPAAN